MKSKTYDYAALDKSWRFNFRAEKKAQAKRHGYRYITELYHQAYLIHGSLQNGARALNVGQESLRRVLLHIGVALRPKGGINKPKLNIKHVHSLRAGWAPYWEANPGATIREYAQAFKDEYRLVVGVPALIQALLENTWKETEEDHGVVESD